MDKRNALPRIVVVAVLAIAAQAAKDTNQPHRPPTRDSPTSPATPTRSGGNCLLPLPSPSDTECSDGFCPLPQTSANEPEFTVLSPVPEAAVEPMASAPRLDTLDGKVIALVGGSFMANVTHPELKRLILAEFPTVKVYLLSEIGSAGP